MQMGFSITLPDCVQVWLVVVVLLALGLVSVVVVLLASGVVSAMHFAKHI